MDFGMLEANTIILRSTIKYLDGDVKIVVEKRIKDNYKVIDQYFDEMANSFKTIDSYEKGDANGN